MTSPRTLYTTRRRIRSTRTHTRRRTRRHTSGRTTRRQEAPTGRRHADVGSTDDVLTFFSFHDKIFFTRLRLFLLFGFLPRSCNTRKGKMLKTLKMGFIYHIKFLKTRKRKIKNFIFYLTCLQNLLLLDTDSFLSYLLNFAVLNSLVNQCTNFVICSSVTL